MVRLGVLVSGTGSNLQAILDAITAGDIAGEVCVVIANQAGAPALERATHAGVEAVCVPHKSYDSRAAFDAKLVETLKAADVEWVILAGFMRLLTPVFLDAFPNRVVNLHPSLLPAFPGVHAARQALDYGAKVTGCTVHLVTEGMDSGPVIAQAPVPILDEDNEASLMQRVHEVEHRLLVDVVAAICDRRIRLVPGVAGERAKVLLNRLASTNGGR